MQLRHEFTVPIPPAWATLVDVERVAPCMPGPTLDHVDENMFSGRVTLKVGPLRMTYRGDARITEEETLHRMVIAVSGRTRVLLLTDLAMTGRAAQFGRGPGASFSATSERTPGG